MIMSPLKNRSFDSCSSTERIIWVHALVFCSQILSCPDSGAAVGSNVTGSWRESPTVENLSTTGS